MSPVQKVYHMSKLKFKTKISKISTKTLDKTTATESFQVMRKWLKLTQSLSKILYFINGPLPTLPKV